LWGLSFSSPAFPFRCSPAWACGCGARLAEYLKLIAANRAAWLWTNGGIVVGVLLTAVGLSGLTALLREAGEGLLGQTGLLLFALGVTFWVIELAFRLSVTVWAAEETANTGSPPAFFEPLHRWVGTLFFVYMVLAYLATAVYGGALLQTGLLPTWVGWVTLGAGLLGALSFVTGLPTIFSIPAGVHLAPLLIGVALLIQIGSIFELEPI
jgi:hypothetical protein